MLKESTNTVCKKRFLYGIVSDFHANGRFTPLPTDCVFD